MSGTMIFAAVCGLPIGLILLFKLDICYFPVLFFAIKFAAARIMDFDRVRNSVMFQLLVITVLLAVIIIRNNGKLKIGDKLFFKFIPVLIIYLIFYSIVGVLNGHAIFQIFIDCYKYLEIIVYYVLFRASWENNNDVFQGIKAFAALMIGLGIVEIFITTRGGVGLNLIMSLFPMVLILSLYDYLPYSKAILLASFLVVASCQTRTYIVGFVLGFMVLLFLLPARKREPLLSFTFLVGIVAVVAIGIFGGQFIGKTLARFAELSEGFEESGGYRIYDYREAFNRFLDHPLLGNGFGYLKKTFIFKMGWIEWGDFVHCLYLEILFKVGISGVLCLLVIFKKFITRIWRYLKWFKEQDDFMFSICCGAFCSFIAWLFTYTFAPLATIGSMFFGPLIASIVLSNYYSENR